MQLANRYGQIDPTVMKLLELTNRPGIIALFEGPLPNIPMDLVADAQKSSPAPHSSAQGNLCLDG